MNECAKVDSGGRWACTGGSLWRHRGPRRRSSAATRPRRRPRCSRLRRPRRARPSPHRARRRRTAALGGPGGAAGPEHRGNFPSRRALTGPRLTTSAASQPPRTAGTTFRPYAEVGFQHPGEHGTADVAVCRARDLDQLAHRRGSARTAVRSQRLDGDRLLLQGQRRVVGGADDVGDLYLLFEPQQHLHRPTPTWGSASPSTTPSGWGPLP